MAAPNGHNAHNEPAIDRDYGSEKGNGLTNTLTLSPEAFERIYLGPKTQVTGQLRSTLANPTPIALLGFSVGLFPLSIAFSEFDEHRSIAAVANDFQ